MLSQEAFFTAIEEEIFPMAQELEAKCLALYNRKHQGIDRRGPTGYSGEDSNEVDYTISRLKSATRFIEELKH